MGWRTGGRSRGGWQAGLLRIESYYCIVFSLSGGPCSDLQKAGSDQDGDGGKLAAPRNQDDCAVKICKAVITNMHLSQISHNSRMSSPPWRDAVLSQLRRRKALEVEPFAQLFKMQEKLQERSLSLFEDNQRLEAEAARLRLREEMQGPIPFKREDGALQAGEVADLQRKLFSVQEELTEMHRRKGENAQQVIDLGLALRLSEKQVEEVRNSLALAEASIIGLKEDLTTSEAIRSETEATSQLLKDEYQALQLALTSAEEKLRTVQKENETLVQQLMALKAMDVERMNFENEMFVAKQQQQMQLELAEAVKEGKSVSPEMVARLVQEGADTTVSCAVTVPSRVHMRFDAHEGEVMSARWDTTGRFFATSGADRKIKIWEMSQRSSPDLRATLVGSNAAVMGIDFDSSGAMILGSSNDFATRVWTVEDSRLRHTLTGHSGKVMSKQSSLSKVLTVSMARCSLPNFLGTPQEWSVAAMTGLSR